MHEVNCYLCGSNSSEVLFSQEGTDVYLSMVSEELHGKVRNWVVCSKCGFVYRNPMLDEYELNMLYQRYEQDVFSTTDPDTYFDKIISLHPEKSENWQKVEWLAGEVERHGNKFRKLECVLDIGCGGGTLMYTLSERIKINRMCGVERNPAYAELASRRLDADIRNENYRSGLFLQTFDLGICTKVLEHVSDPLPFLKEINRDIKAEGLLFIEVPDISDIYNLPPDNPRFYIPHVYYYSFNTLGELIARAGFENVTSRVVTTWRNRSYLQILAKKNERQDVSEPPYDNTSEITSAVFYNKEKCLD